MQEKDKTQLYIQLSRHNEVQAGPVRLADVAELYGLESEEKEKLAGLELMRIKREILGATVCRPGKSRISFWKNTPGTSQFFSVIRK